MAANSCGDRGALQRRTRKPDRTEHAAGAETSIVLFSQAVLSTATGERVMAQRSLSEWAAFGEIIGTIQRALAVDRVSVAGPSWPDAALLTSRRRR